MMEVNVKAKRQQRKQKEPLFHFCFFGNFSGRSESRERFDSLEVTRSNLPQLMERLKPSVALHVELPNMEDLRSVLRFSKLKDFGDRGLRAAFPLLTDLKALRNAVATTNEDQPLDVAGLRRKHTALDQVAQLAAANCGSDPSETLDLLSLVDMGDDQQLALPVLQKLFVENRYDGKRRAALLKEVDEVAGLIGGQILGNPEIQRLHGLWRGLRTCLGQLPVNVRVTMVDATKADLCDATWSLFVKPDKGAPLPLDLAVYLEPLAHGEDDCHIIHHLGRMAEALAVPMLLEAHLNLFGLRAWRFLNRAQQVGRTFSGPNHLKWRKLRDEPGSQWLFPCVNPVQHKSSGDENEGVLLPAVLVAAALLGAPLEDEGMWPSELLRPDAVVDLGEEPAGTISAELADDMAFWGISPVGQAEDEGLCLMGMTAFARVTRQNPETFSTADLVPYTLTYRFYAGCCARYLREARGDMDGFRRFAALQGETSLEIQEEDGQQILRIKPAFTIFRVRPDFVVGTN